MQCRKIDSWATGEFLESFGCSIERRRSNCRIRCPQVATGESLHDDFRPINQPQPWSSSSRPQTSKVCASYSAGFGCFLYVYHFNSEDITFIVAGLESGVFSFSQAGFLVGLFADPRADVNNRLAASPGELLTTSGCPDNFFFTCPHSDRGFLGLIWKLFESPSWKSRK